MVLGSKYVQAGSVIFFLNAKRSIETLMKAHWASNPLSSKHTNITFVHNYTYIYTQMTCLSSAVILTAVVYTL